MDDTQSDVTDLVSLFLALGWTPPAEAPDSVPTGDTKTTRAPETTHAPETTRAPETWPAGEPSLVTEPSPAEERAITRTRALVNRERANSLLERAADASSRAAQLRDLADGTQAAVRVHLGQAAALRAQSERIRELEEEVDHLQKGLDSRPRIEHVIGMLMLLMSCGPEAAWGALSHVSQMTNRRVRDIADVIADRVSRGEGLPPELTVALRDVMPPPK